MWHPFDIQDAGWKKTTKIYWDILAVYDLFQYLVTEHFYWKCLVGVNLVIKIGWRKLEKKKIMQKNYRKKKSPQRDGHFKTFIQIFDKMEKNKSVQDLGQYFSKKKPILIRQPVANK